MSGEGYEGGGESTRVNKSVCLKFYNVSRLRCSLRPRPNSSPYSLQTLLQSVHTHTHTHMHFNLGSDCHGNQPLNDYSLLRRIIGTKPSQAPFLPLTVSLVSFSLQAAGTAPLSLFVLLLSLLLHVQEQTLKSSCALPPLPACF